MVCRHCPLSDYDVVGKRVCRLLPIEDEGCKLIYTDKKGEVIGCYVQRWLIEKEAAEVRLAELKGEKK